MSDVDGGQGDRIALRLADLGLFGRDAQYTVGLGQHAYLADTPEGRILRNSGRHILIQVATVVEKLPDDFKAEYPEVDWVGIGRMRNLIAHHYDRVDDELVFRALASRIPELLHRLGVSRSDHTGT